jgi:hypothetical protein
MKDYPRAGDDEICRRVRDALDGPDAKYQNAFFDYCTRNHFNLLYKDERGAAGRKSRRQAKVALTAEQEAAIAKRAKTILAAAKAIALMELPTPFGKPLGDLTEAEGHELTGWQASLFDGIGDQRLRDVKSEKDLQAAWRASIIG